MSTPLWILLAGVLLFTAYREFCQVRFYLACRRAKGKRFRGVRIVYSRRGAPRRSTSGHLRLVATSRKVSV